MSPSKNDDGISNGLDKVLEQTKNSIPYRYPCETQSPRDTKTRKSTPTELNLGLKGVIPRWQTGSIIKWAVDRDNFGSPEDASYAVDSLMRATASWNKLNLGVIFQFSEEVAHAVFTLKFNGDNDETLAEAFLPNTKLSNYLYIYSRAFKADAREHLDKVFMHEAGHILGLRHEFAAEEGDFVLFGEKNPSSVMSYLWPPQMTEQDMKETQEFYAWTAPEIRSTENSYKVVSQMPRGGR